MDINHFETGEAEMPRPRTWVDRPMVDQVLTVKEKVIREEADYPYLITERTTVERLARFNPLYGDRLAKCDCGHPYHRHFDSYDNDYPIGCKYCGCNWFVKGRDQESAD